MAGALHAVILICSLVTTPDIGDCTRANAVDVLVAPDTTDLPSACLQTGQEFLAHSAIIEDLVAGYVPRFTCERIAGSSKREAG